jgi:hypothetical protein
MNFKEKLTTIKQNKKRIGTEENKDRDKDKLRGSDKNKEKNKDKNLE